MENALDKIFVHFSSIYIYLQNVVIYYIFVVNTKLITLVLIKESELPLVGNMYFFIVAFLVSTATKN